MNEFTLKPEYVDALREFAAVRGVTMLNVPDDVYPERWIRVEYEGIQKFSERNGVSIPSQLSRNDIFGAASSSPPDVFSTFLWSMMWGYQSDGTGAYRTNVAITADNRTPIEVRLSNLFEAAKSGDLARAFSLMRGSQSRVRNVNTAFGTKYFYFAGFDERNTSAIQPLILDRRVVSALKKLLLHPSSMPNTYQDLMFCSFVDYSWYLNCAKWIRDEYIPFSRVDVVEFFLWCQG